MERENDAPKPQQFSDFQTPIPECKPLKVKIIQLKGEDGPLYSIVFNLLENAILIEVFDSNDISNTKYLSNLSLENFQKISNFFMQFPKIDEIFSLLEEMQQEEFKIEKNNSQTLDLFLLIEIRKKINKIKINLTEQKKDINKIVLNLCEKIKELNVLKEEIKEIKNVNKLVEEITNLKEKNEKLENIINTINEKLENKIKEDYKIINDLKEENKLLNEKLENINKELENYKKENKKENKILENKINDDKKINNLGEKLDKISTEIETYKKENRNDLIKIYNNVENNKVDIERNKRYINNNNIIFNLNDKIFNELSESYNYITNNRIKIDSNIIKNNFELAQINNGIKHGFSKNIKKIKLLYRCSRDGDYKSKVNEKIVDHNNLLFLIETSENKKFGGFTSLYYKTSGDGQKDDYAFIFSLDNKENYYIIKGKNAVYFSQNGVSFGLTYAGGSEFNIMWYEPCLTGYNSCDDTGSNNCYDYGGRKHILAGKFSFVVLEFEAFEISF